MKKKIIIVILILVLVLGVVIFLVNKPINNHYIAYGSQENKTELINALEEEDYKLASNLVYSVANSEYYEESVQEVLDDKYYGVEPFDYYYSLYRGLIDLLQYIDINEDSSFELKQVDMNNLSTFNMVYFEYELDGVAGYYVNYLIHDKYGSEWVYDRLNIVESKKQCIDEDADKDVCERFIYLDMANDMYYNENDYNAFETEIDYTIVMEDYKNVDQEPIVNYSSNEEFDYLVSIVYDLDKIEDSATSQEERDELQYALIEEAQENGNSNYGDYSFDGTVNKEDMLDSGVNGSVYGTYNIANSDDSIDKFIEEDYYNKDGTLDMNRLVEDYDEYRNMFLQIDYDITQYIDQ